MTDHIANLIGLDPEVALAVSAVQDELLPQVHRYRAAWRSARRRAAGRAGDAVEAMEDMATELYKAEDRLAFVREMCDLADREQRTISTEQVRAWTQYTGCGGAIVLPEADQAALQERLEADRYAAMVNAPLRPESIAAIAERIKSGDLPVRKIKARVRDMGREPAVLAIPDDELQPLLALADDETEQQ